MTPLRDLAKDLAFTGFGSRDIDLRLHRLLVDPTPDPTRDPTEASDPAGPTVPLCSRSLDAALGHLPGARTVLPTAIATVERRGHPEGHYAEALALEVCRQVVQNHCGSPPVSAAEVPQAWLSLGYGWSPELMIETKRRTRARGIADDDLRRVQAVLGEVRTDLDQAGDELD